VKTKTSEEGSGELIYLHCADDGAVEEGEITLSDGKTAKVLWKDVLVEGTYPMTPGPNGAVDKPMHVVASGDSDAKTRTISMSDLIASHEDGAFKYVTIPTKHRDDLLDNTGFVPRPDGVRVVEKTRGGKKRKVFQAALGFTEPEIAGKVKRGTIPDVSGGIFFNWLNKHTKKRYPAAMKHVALTPVPFMGNLDPFPPVFASDDLNEDALTTDLHASHFVFDDSIDSGGTSGGIGDPTTGTGDGASTGEIVWNENEGTNWLREQIEVALRPPEPQDDGRPFTPQPYYWVKDVAVTNKALVQESFKGESKTFVIPFTPKEGSVEIAPATRWIESREAMIAASDDNFAELTTSAIREKLGIALSDMAGDGSYQLGDLTVDNRVRIKNEQGSEWVAEFSVQRDGAVHLAPAPRWKKTTEATTDDTGQQPPASSDQQKVVLSDDDPLSARVRAARAKRRSLLPS
jgi:hypothetical protein